MNDLRRPVEPPRAAPPPEPEVVDLGALVGRLWRGKWLVSLVAIVAVVMAGLYAYGLATPTFRATATLVLEQRQNQVVDLGSVVGAIQATDTAINTEVEILRGRRLMGQVVDRLGLVADPEFNATLREPGALGRAKAAVKDGARALLGIAPEPEAAPTPAVIRERVISAALDALAVTNLPLTLVFTVQVETEGPGKSAAIANALAERYVADQVDVKYAATEQATQWLAERVAETGQQLQAADRAVKDFQAAEEVRDAAAVAGDALRLSDLRAQAAEADGAVAAAGERLDALRAAGTDAERAELSSDSVLLDLAGSGEVPAGARAAFDRRFAGVVTEAAQALEAARAGARQAGEAVADLQASIDRQSAALVRLDQLSREAEALRLVYQDLLGRFQETSAQQGLQQPDSRILAPAVPPERPAAPQKARLLAMAGVLGLLAGVALVFLRDLGRRGVEDARALAALTGVPVVGALPRLNGRRPVLQALAREPASPFAEAVRNLRTSVLLGRAGPPRVVAVTSAERGEGKTTLALALARSLAATGRRTILVDADLRRRPARGAARPGLGAVLAGSAQVQDAIARDEGLGADLLGGAAAGAAPADALASDAFARLVAELRERYDAVVMDTPPVLGAPDARIVAREADLVLMAVQWGRTAPEAVEAGAAQVESAGGEVGGLVLTQVPARGLAPARYAARRPRHA